LLKSQQKFTGNELALILANISTKEMRTVTVITYSILALSAIFPVVSDAESVSTNTYQTETQQGTVVTSKMLLQLHSGMAKSEVRSILGAPLVADGSHDSRWDYFYQIRENGKAIEKRRVILTFENEALVLVRSDMATAANKSMAASNNSEAKPKQAEQSINATANSTKDKIDSVSASATVTESKLDHTEDTSNAQQSEALPDAIKIEGDKLSLYFDRKMKASGNAVITRDNQKVYGDNIEYNILNDELEVNGNVRIDLDNAQIKGPNLRMRLSETVGEMRDASILLNKSPTESNLDYHNNSALLQEHESSNQDPKLYVEGDSALNSTSGLTKNLEGSRGDAKTILFEGQNKKRLKSARYTTCEAGVDDWYIKASDIEINDYTSYIDARNAYIEFKGVPILYTPWLGFSYNNQRKSGILAPTFGTTSRSGFELYTPFYWNIRPDMDATLATRYLSKRGVQLQGEFRYLGESYSGIDNLEYLNNDSLSGNTRYYAKLAHRQNFGEGWSAGYNIEKVSDDQYFSELSTRIVSTSRVNLPQEGFVDYQNDNWHFNGLIQKYQTLDQTSYPYERLPQLTLTGDETWGIADTKLTSQYTYFDRNPKAGKAVTGSRLMVYPTVSVPIERSYGYITPKFGVHASSYILNNNDFTVNGQTVSDNTQNRTLPVFSLDSGLYFDAPTEIFNTAYTHTIEPRLFYVYIPYKDQSHIPVFDTSLADLNLTTLFTENQFNGDDRINNANQLSFALTSRLIDDKTGIERISATIGERYYLDKQKVTLPGVATTDRYSSDVVAGFTARLSSQWNVDAFWQYDPDQNTMTRNNLLARYNPEPGKLLNMGYRYTKDFLEQINISGQWPLSNGWYGVGRYNYSLRDKNLIESVVGLEYDAGCWQMRGVIQRVETATANQNYALFFQLELGGLASVGSNPLSVLERNIPGYLSSGEIPNFYREQNYQQ
jgi:LPS-assembly protein